MSFLLGVIEGFYGQPWPQAERLNTLAWMPGAGLNTYVYAPKADRHLRRDWRRPHEPDAWRELLTLRQTAGDADVSFGLGFSPWGLQQHMGWAEAAALRQAVQRLNRLQPDLFCILFDDMPGGRSDLAERQLAVIEEVLSVSTASCHMICPTYYSQDPILEELFGAMPADYLQQLGEGVPAETGLLWTGRKVLSSGYRQEDIDWVTERSGLPVVLWDNYPVNDGRKTSDFLHLSPFRERPWQIQQWCAGHLSNPMNQAALSRRVLASLGQLYQQREHYRPVVAWEAMLADCPPALANLLQRDRSCFEEQGLSSLDERQRQRLSGQYRRVPDSAAVEIAAWLDGVYQFDPDCLND